MSARSVDRLIVLGRDREAAEMAVRDAGADPEEGRVLGPLEQFDVAAPPMASPLDALAAFNGRQP